MIRLWVFLFLFLLQSNLVSGSDDGWDLVRDKNGIQVFRKPIEGSQIDAVRGVTTIKSSIVRLASIIHDPTLRVKWDQFCGESYRYQSVNKTEDLVYVHSDMPWPVSDRDTLMRVNWEQDTETFIVRIKNVGIKGILPEIDGRIRVTKLTHDWVLKPIGDGLIEVETIAHLDPAGPLPAWLINMLSVDSPYDALSRIRDMVQDPKVRPEEISFVLEP